MYSTERALRLLDTLKVTNSDKCIEEIIFESYSIDMNHQKTQSFDSIEDATDYLLDNEDLKHTVTIK